MRDFFARLVAFVSVEPIKFLCNLIAGYSQLPSAFTGQVGSLAQESEAETQPESKIRLL